MALHYLLYCRPVHFLYNVYSTPVLTQPRNFPLGMWTAVLYMFSQMHVSRFLAISHVVADISCPRCRLEGPVDESTLVGKF